MLIITRWGMHFRFLILLLIFFGGSLFAQGPDLKFEHITSDQGLPQNTIHGIVKDKYGFMWFGTWAGVCRYDGYSFKTYIFDPANPKSINSNRIHNIIKDSDQNIWVLTFQEEELCRYNYEKDNFDRIPVSKVSKQFVKLITRRNHIQTVNYTYKQHKWDLDISSNSLVGTDLRSNREKYYSHTPADAWSLNDPYVSDIYKDDHNVFWVGTYSNGVNKASLNAKPFAYYYHDPYNTNSIVDNNVRAICEDNAGNLWVGTRDKGITVISKSGYRQIKASKGRNTTINNDQIKRIFCDSRGIVWIGQKIGINSYNPATGSFRFFAEQNLWKTSVFGITEDNEQNIWFASWRGLYKYIPSQDRLVHFDPEKTLKSPHARVVIHDRKQRMWVGTEGGGVSILKPVPGRDSLVVVKHLLHDFSGKNSVRDNRINSIHEDKQGFMWIGTGNGLERYDPAAEKFTSFSAKRALGGIAVAAIMEDDKGNLWISHKNGISRLNKKTFAVRTFTLQDGLQSNEFSDGAAFKGRFSKLLYMGGNKGLNAFNPDSIIPETTVPNTVLTELQILNHNVGIEEKINGRVVLSRPLHLTREIELTYDDKSVAIEFAGLHYANPKANKYAYKLEGFDKDWVYTDASRRLATYSNLHPGNYVFKVISSNSDGIWNLKPAVLKILVRPPFWASIWAYILYLIIFLSVLYIYHTYSLRYGRLKAELSYKSLIHDKENELHQSKLEFFTNISHEIKTPLTLILAPVEKLVHLFSENRSVFTELVTMRKNGDRLLKLVNQLLDFRKLETGNMEVSCQRKDVVLFLRNTLGTFEPLAATKDITLEFISQSKEFYLLYDEDKLEKVVSNLLLNALKFTPASGWIKLGFKIKSEPSGEKAVVEVTNSGKIIPEDEREKIFYPFQQGSGNKAGGTGLGLAYSRGLIELHGGTIGVSSSEMSAEQGETTFTIQLPLMSSGSISSAEEAVYPPISEKKTEFANSLALASEGAAEVHEYKEKVLVNGKVPVILIVEDSTDLRKYLKGYLDGLYQIIEAENGLEGLQTASEELPDLVISDVMMPEMDGFELCRRIKTDLTTAHIPVILLTARTPEEDRIAGIETGADDYITKPFNLVVLTARIKSLLVSRNKLKEKYRKEISLKHTEVPESSDEKLLKKVLEYVEERLSDPGLSIDDICRDVGVSRTHLYRKIKTSTGLSMAEVIKEIRLKRAKQLLKDKKFNINEVSYMIGFSDTDYFRKCFKSEFKITPSEYYKSKTEQ